MGINILILTPTDKMLQARPVALLCRLAVAAKVVAAAAFKRTLASNVESWSSSKPWVTTLLDCDAANLPFHWVTRSMTIGHLRRKFNIRSRRMGNQFIPITDHLSPFSLYFGQQTLDQMKTRTHKKGIGLSGLGPAHRPLPPVCKI